MKNKNTIFCAIDTPDLDIAVPLANSLRNEVYGFKIGLEFYLKNGIVGVRHVVNQKGGENTPLFLDLKFHDIPNTVAGAVRSVAGCGAEFVTVHASGGEEMMKAAVEAAEPTNIKIVAVTALTSMGDSSKVRQLADSALYSGIRHMVCSAHEVKMLRSEFGTFFNDLTFITPAIRPRGYSDDDQKRTATPQEAITVGADYLVIGRPITQSPDPVQATKDIVNSVDEWRT